MMADFVVELVVAELLLARQQAKGIRLDDGVPVARLGADRAVAFVRALAQIDVGLELNRATVAASLVGLQHRRLRESDRPDNLGGSPKRSNVFDANPPARSAG